MVIDMRDSIRELAEPWPTIPAALERLWFAVSGFMHPPEATLINWYRPETKSKMGMHVDNDENNFDAPVVSVFFGRPSDI